MVARSPEARTAAKKAQLARLAAKGSPEYPALYASQPEQIRKGAEQRAERAKHREMKAAVIALATSEANKAVDVFSKAGNLTTKGAK